MKSKILDNVIFGQLIKVTEVALLTVLSVLLSRGLGPSGYGNYAFVTTVVDLVRLAASLGFSIVLLTYVPRLMAAEEGHQKTGRLLRRLWVTRGLILGGFACVLWAMAGVISRVFGQPMMETYRWAIGLMLLVSGLSVFWMIFHTALMNMKVVWIVGSVKVALTVGVIFWMKSRGELSLGAVLWTMGVVNAAVIGGYVWVGRSFLRAPKPSRDTDIPWEELWRLGITSWVVTLLSFFLGSQLNVLFLSYFLGSSPDLGYFAISMMLLTQPPLMFMTGWGSISLPVFSGQYAVGGHEALRKTWTFFSILSLFTIVPAMCALAWVAPSFVELVFGPHFRISVEWLWWGMLFCSPTFILPENLTQNLFYASGQESALLKFRVGGVVVHVLLNVLLIPWWGGKGAIAAFALTSTAVVVGQYWYWRPRLSLRLPWPVIISFGLVLMISTLVLWWFFGVSGVRRTAWSLGSELGLFVALMMGGLWAVKPLRGMDQSIWADAPALAKVFRLFV